jgi:hypothetical protein
MQHLKKLMETEGIFASYSTETLITKGTITPLKQVAKWLSEADCVLIGAGAGISVEAGNDYLGSFQLNILR